MEKKYQARAPETRQDGVRRERWDPPAMAWDGRVPDQQPWHHDHDRPPPRGFRHAHHDRHANRFGVRPGSRRDLGHPQRQRTTAPRPAARWLRSPALPLNGVPGLAHAEPGGRRTVTASVAQSNRPGPRRADSGRSCLADHIPGGRATAFSNLRTPAGSGLTDVMARSGRQVTHASSRITTCGCREALTVMAEPGGPTTACKSPVLRDGTCHKPTG